jgi:hypothetical protein
MTPDYPCSHSMDTTWFAVDEAGHLGMFNSGENGHVPDLAPADHTRDLARELWQRRNPEREEEDLWELDDEEIANQLGVYYFAYGDEFDPIGTYGLMAAPERPLHVDQLPPDLRKEWKGLRLQLDFTQVEELQPLEHEECCYWYEEDRVAYLCSDGKTVRPIRGKEDKFAEFCRQFRTEHPEEAAKLVFEEAPPKPRRRRKGKDDGR